MVLWCYNPVTHTKEINRRMGGEIYHLELLRGTHVDGESTHLEAVFLHLEEPYNQEFLCHERTNQATIVKNVLATLNILQ